MRCLLSTWVMISPYISSVLTLLCTAICTRVTFPWVIIKQRLPHLNVRVVVEIVAETVIVAKLHHTHLQIIYREVNINELTSHHMNMELTDIKYYGIMA